MSMTAAKRNIRRARTNTKFMRDCGSAIAVGGASIALTLIIGGLAIQKEAYVALLLLEGILIGGSAYFEWRARSALTARSPIWYTVQIAIVGTVIVAFGVSVAAEPGHDWPASAYTASWWALVGFSLSAAFVGAMLRRVADRLLDDLDEERIDGLTANADIRRYQQRQVIRRQR